jgi:hypothetical protein
MSVMRESSFVDAQMEQTKEGTAADKKIEQNRLNAPTGRISFSF